MENRVGEEFDGIVTSVTSFGLFVELDGIYIEGLVHVTDLSNDYYHYDPSNHILKGEKTKQVFSLGDKIEVRVARVSVLERKIDLHLSGSKLAVKAIKRKKERKRDVSSKPATRSKNKGRKKRNLNKEAKRKQKLVGKKPRAKR
tara:strand:- start:301 stop:732 length:432 start_codon:yes stop_codon:yes gene_type:complete